MRGMLTSMVLCIGSILFSPLELAAAWPADGLPVCTAPGLQLEVVSCSDGAGGMILAWRDQRPDDGGIYVQRISSAGTPSWTVNGIRVSAYGHGGAVPAIASDGRGGAWIVWEENANPYYDIYMQRIDASGAPSWAGPGGAAIRIGTAHFTPRRPVCVSDGSEGVVVAFSELPLSGENLVVAQRFDATGNALWSAPAIVAGEGIQTGGLLSAAVPYEGEGGILLAWVGSTNAGTAQWVDTNGSPRWNGTYGYGVGPVVTGSRVKIARRERYDHGAHVLYQRTHSFGGHTYFEWRVKAIAESAVERWDASAGDSRTTGPDANIHHAYGGGCVVGWYYLHGSPTEIYVYGRRFEGNGSMAWDQLLGHRPVAFSGAAPAVVWSEGSYFGYRFVWPALIDGVPRLLYRAMGANPGEALPDPGPLTLTSTWSSATPTMTACSHSPEVVLLGWRDERTVVETDVYATALRSGGTLPYPNLRIRSLRATPNPAEIATAPTIRGVVVNEGLVDAEGFAVGYWRDLPAPAGAPDWEDDFPAGLARNDSLVIEFGAPSPATTPCTWHSWMRADFENDVDEGSAENDNDREMLLTWIATADLTISSFAASSTSPAAGTPITYTIAVTNIGHAASDACALRLYHDRASPPDSGTPADAEFTVPSVAAGSTHTVHSAAVTHDAIEPWSSFAFVDATGIVSELREDNNIDGPLSITWSAPLDPGWPVSAGSGSLHSPVIASLPTQPRGQRAVIVTSTDGYCHAWDGQGDPLDGWPYAAGSPLHASAAVADLDGDGRLETVFGDASGAVHCVDENGIRRWRISVGAPVVTAVVLADLAGHGGNQQVVVGDTSGKLHVLDHEGRWIAGWPRVLGARIDVAPAVGDLDATVPREIVAIATDGPSKSRVYVLRPDGSTFHARWPLILNTSFVGSPALGDVVGGPDLDIVAGGIDGLLRVWEPRSSMNDLTVDLGAPIGTSVTLARLDALSPRLAMIVATDVYVSTPPFGDHWQSVLWTVLPSGAPAPGWPVAISKRSMDCRAGDGAIVWGTPKSPWIAIGSEAGDCFVFDRSGTRLPGFTMPVSGPTLGSLAAHDIDGDLHLEVIVAGTGEVRSYDLLAGSYTVQHLQWNQFGHDPQRTHCYGMDHVTAVDEPTVPARPASSGWVRAFPNPFNPQVTLVFDLAVDGRVEIEVLDTSGRRVRTMPVPTNLHAGRHAFVWDGCDDRGQRVGSGVYRVEFSATDAVGSIDVVLIK